MSTSSGAPRAARTLGMSRTYTGAHELLDTFHLPEKDLRRCGTPISKSFRPLLFTPVRDSRTEET